jgi:predicted nucleotide-binding protein
MSNIDALVAAFSEYAAENWEAAEWQQFGRGTGTSDILSNHGRLYRSLTFGDPDYPDAVWQVVPLVLNEGTGTTTREKMTLVADFAPKLVAWIDEAGSHRTKKRFAEFLVNHHMEIPQEWAADAHGLRTNDVPALYGSPLARSAQQSVQRLGQAVLSAPAHPTAALPSAARQVPLPKPAVNGEHGRVPSSATTATVIDEPKRIFVVHGHDHAAVNEIKVFVHRITGIMPEILADQPGAGDTIIEKFEKHADKSDYAIVLLTADDEGRVKNAEAALQPRARQNVVLELGYFFGKLGRHRVAVLNGGVEQPSDVHGLNYISYRIGTWTEELRAEMRTAGFTLVN